MEFQLSIPLVKSWLSIRSEHQQSRVFPSPSNKLNWKYAPFMTTALDTAKSTKLVTALRTRTRAPTDQSQKPSAAHTSSACSMTKATKRVAHRHTKRHQYFWATLLQFSPWPQSLTKSSSCCTARFKSSEYSDLFTSCSNSTATALKSRSDIAVHCSPERWWPWAYKTTASTRWQRFSRMMSKLIELLQFSHRLTPIFSTKISQTTGLSAWWPLVAKIWFWECRVRCWRVEPLLFIGLKSVFAFETWSIGGSRSVAGAAGADADGATGCISSASANSEPSDFPEASPNGVPFNPRMECEE